MHRVSRATIPFLLAINLVLYWGGSRETTKISSSLAVAPGAPTAAPPGAPDDMLQAPMGGPPLREESPSCGPVPTRDPSTWALVPTSFLLAGLAYLATTQDGLSPHQAATLAPVLDDLVRDLRTQGSCYPRLCRILDEAQLREFVQALQDMHSGKLNASSLLVPAGEATLYLRGRASP